MVGEDFCKYTLTFRQGVLYLWVDGRLTSQGVGTVLKADCPPKTGMDFEYSAYRQFLWKIR